MQAMEYKIQPDKSLDFLLAGKSHFTIKSLKSNQHFTYRINKKTGNVSNSVFGDYNRGVLKVDKIGKHLSIYRFFSTKEVMINLEITPEGIKSIIEIK